MTPLLVAHRGASIDRPEHTLAAYELAVEQGADGLECDVRLTRDGHLVCVHDRTVSRTSNGRGAVGDRTLAELAELDFGSWHSRPEPLLTLRGLLELVADTGVRLFVETKHPARHGAHIEARLLEVLGEYGLANGKATVLSFSSTALRRIAAGAPEVPTVLLTDGVAARRPLPKWASIAGPSLSTLRTDPEYVRRAGREVYAWTADTREEVARCAELGVRYIATNLPGQARAWL